VEAAVPSDLAWNGKGKTDENKKPQEHQRYLNRREYPENG